MIEMGTGQLVYIPAGKPYWTWHNVPPSKNPNAPSRLFNGYTNRGVTRHLDFRVCTIDKDCGWVEGEYTHNTEKWNVIKLPQLSFFAMRIFNGSPRQRSL